VGPSSFEQSIQTILSHATDPSVSEQISGDLLHFPRETNVAFNQYFPWNYGLEATGTVDPYLSPFQIFQQQNSPGSATAFNSFQSLLPLDNFFSHDVSEDPKQQLSPSELLVRSDSSMTSHNSASHLQDPSSSPACPLIPGAALILGDPKSSRFGQFQSPMTQSIPIQSSQSFDSDKRNARLPDQGEQLPWLCTRPRCGESFKTRLAFK
jgi:hypothetical protein